MPLNSKIDLDGLYTAEQIAPWMQLNKRIVLEKARQMEIPSQRIGTVVRFHPRSILEHTRHPQPKPQGRRHAQQTSGGRTV